MSILDRLNLLIRSNINDSIGRHDQPTTRQALNEMESSLRDARRQQIELRRGEKALIEQIRDVRNRADQWEDRAMLALRNGDEELAREALVVKNQAMNEARRLRDQLDEHRAYIKDIERALEALEVKLEGTRSRLRSLSSRPASRLSSTGSGGERLSDWDAKMAQRSRLREGGVEGDDFETDRRFDTSDSFREMDRMASKIDTMEAEIEAMRELGSGGDSRRAELERVFASMEGRGRPSAEPRRDSRDERSGSNRPPMDDDLADLKKKFE